MLERLERIKVAVAAYKDDLSGRMARNKEALEIISSSPFVNAAGEHLKDQADIEAKLIQVSASAGLLSVGQGDTLNNTYDPSTAKVLLAVGQNGGGIVTSVITGEDGLPKSLYEYYSQDKLAQEKGKIIPFKQLVDDKDSLLSRSYAGEALSDNDNAKITAAVIRIDRITGAVGSVSNKELTGLKNKIIIENDEIYDKVHALRSEGESLENATSAPKALSGTPVMP